MDEPIAILDFKATDRNFLGLSMHCFKCRENSTLGRYQVPIKSGVATITCPRCLNEGKGNVQSLIDSDKPFLI